MLTFRIAIQTAVLFALPVLAASDHQRVHLLPQFRPGDSLRYQIESQMTSAGTTTTPIVNPEGATQVKQSVSIILRLDVLEVQPAASRSARASEAKPARSANRAPVPNAAPGPRRIHATNEKSSATSESTATDPL